MFEEFDECLKNNLLNTINEMKKIGINIYGSEVLLLTLMNDEESLCYFLLSKINITYMDIENEIKKMLFIRKNNEIHTEKFAKIINDSNDISNYEDSDFIYDEHVLYAILLDEDNVANQILKNLLVNTEDLLNKVLDFFEEEEPFLTNLSNINTCTYIGGKYYIDKIIRILYKVKKNNCMIIGNAGVGKSSLVEAVAKKLKENKSNFVVYRLDISSLMAGTKYRGDLEERILKIINKIKKKNIIIFIDEIHNIIQTGSSEGSLDIANILKPYLANGEIKCIGATTLDEYYKYICKDQALTRRFQNVFLEEASNSQTYNILLGIKSKYENIHNVFYTKDVIKYIIELMDLIPNRKMPDKAIDILDESGILAKTNNKKNVTKNDIRQVTYEYLGIKQINIDDCVKQQLIFKSLYKYYEMYFLAIGIRKNIVTLALETEKLDLLLKDIYKVFNIKKESILNINMKEFNTTADTSLLGVSSGYIGYENGGILSEHIIKYPISVIVINDYENSNPKLQKQIETLITKGEVIDGKGRTIKAINTVFVFTNLIEKLNIGFNRFELGKSILKKYSFIDEYINIDYNYYNDVKKLIYKMRQNDYYFFINKRRIDYATYEKIKSEITDVSKLKRNIKYNVLMNNTNNIVIEKK